MPRDDRHIRLFVEHDLIAGATISLTAEQGHHLRNVMRCGVGDGVDLFNGRDGEWRARLVAVEKRNAVVEIGDPVRPQFIEADPWLLFAPVKGGRVEQIVEKATELGVSRLRPVVTARTVVPRINAKRLYARAVEAAEQCGRLTVPSIDPPERLDRVIGNWPTGRTLLWCDESGGGRPIAEAVQQMAAPAWAVMTGPEGGYAPPELDAVRKLPFVTPISLGGRILRADTAAVAAFACVQAMIGDWRCGPSTSDDG